MPRPGIAALALLALAFGLLRADFAAARVAVTTVRPSASDAAITTFDQPHRIFLDAAASSRSQLLVFLPGTGATTADQDEFGTAAATLGYHVVYLMYPNDVAAADCQDDDDPDTFEQFRREIITGRDLSPRIDVDRANSIENRLLKLVRWLAAQRGEEHWAQFLDGDRIAWDKVVLAGHSQGGGHAQLMAKDHAVARVVVFGSPKDYNRRHRVPAPWYGGGATPANRLFALVHEQDEQACSYAEQLENLRRSGLTTTASIDGASAPYAHAHLLTTNQPGKKVNSALAHLGLVFDFMIPRVGGKNPYVDAWRYLLSEPVDAPATR